MKKLDIFIQNQRIKQIKQYLPDNAYCLDIGAFKGELFESCKDKIVKGVGVEPLLKKPIKKKQYTIYPGYFPEALPSDMKMGFDVITMLAVLEHIPDKQHELFAQNCFKLLKKGGLLIITVPSLRVDMILKILGLFKLIDGMSLEEHHGFVPKQTKEIFDKKRFKLEVEKTFQLGLNNLFIFSKK